MMHVLVLAVLFVLLICATAAQARADATTQPIRVMSFNIRCSTANDGENHWAKRRENFLQTVERFDPDLLGFQEVVADQADVLRERFARTHTFVGVGRDDGKRAGEFAAILFRNDRFEIRDRGHIWLSELPEKPGSVSWDSALTRMASWVTLRDKRDPQNRELIFLNTHFDHVGQVARLESAKLLRTRLEQLSDGGKRAIIFTGDLNCFEDDPPVRELLRGELIDAYRAVHPTREPNEATFHGFKGEQKGGRIDFILYSSQVNAREATIDRTAQAGRYPSDHFAITATLHWSDK